MASFGFSAQVVRQFGTTALRSGKIVTPPLQVYGTEGRYATAFYSAALKQKKLDLAERETKKLQELLAKDKKLVEFIANPSLQRVEKKAILETALANQRFSELMVNLASVMTENGRIQKISGVLSAFNEIMAAHRGEVVCVVKTAKEMDTGTLKEVRTALEGFLRKGEKLHLKTEVDPSLLGGMVVSVGDKFVDMSMAAKIRNYTNIIKQPA